MKKIAVYPGTFDPITNGHIDILKRSIKLFDEVVILIAERKEKQTLFNLGERIEIANRVVKNFKNVKVDFLKEELLVDYLKRSHIRFIIRGLRSISDFEYELQMALMNREFLPDLETVFIVGGKDTIFLSSTLIREIALNKGDFSKFVPEEVSRSIKMKLGGKNGTGKHLK